MAEKGIYFQVKGQEECAFKMRRIGLSAIDGVAKEIAKTLVEIHNKAKKAARVGVSGELRAGIHWRMDRRALSGEVGSYVKHAAFMEFGTGPHGAATNEQDLPPWYRHGSHHNFPPVVALESWARKKGMSGGTVAGIIYLNQGIPARPYFYPAVREETLNLISRMGAKFSGTANLGGIQ